MVAFPRFGADLSDASQCRMTRSLPMGSKNYRPSNGSWTIRIIGSTPPVDSSICVSTSLSLVACEGLGGANPEPPAQVGRRQGVEGKQVDKRPNYVHPDQHDQINCKSDQRISRRWVY